METLELMLIAPILYIVLKLSIRAWNDSLDSAYNEAQVKASILLGSGQRNEANEVMDRALSDLRRFRIRKVLGFKI